MSASTKMDVIDLTAEDDAAPVGPALSSEPPVSSGPTHSRAEVIDLTGEDTAASNGARSNEPPRPFYTNELHDARVMELANANNPNAHELDALGMWIVAKREHLLIEQGICNQVSQYLEALQLALEVQDHAGTREWADNLAQQLDRMKVVLVERRWEIGALENRYQEVYLRN